MSFTYGGVTPDLVVKTNDLNGTEKLSLDGGKLVKNQHGVCMSMVVDWIAKCQRLNGGVTKKNELKSGIALSLAQTAYMRNAFKGGDEGFIESQGVDTDGSRTFDEGYILIDAAMRLIGLTGFATVTIYGKTNDAWGAHTLGFRQSGGKVQFFDPNEGILQFPSANDFGNWFPSYIKDRYPNRRQGIKLIRMK